MTRLPSLLWIFLSCVIVTAYNDDEDGWDNVSLFHAFLADKTLPRPTTYDTPRRQQIFHQQNQNPSTTYQLGIHPYSDLLPSKVPKGYIKPYHRHHPWNIIAATGRRDRMLSRGGGTTTPLESIITTEPVADLPVSVDWRKKGITPVSLRCQGHLQARHTLSSSYSATAVATTTTTIQHHQKQHQNRRRFLASSCLAILSSIRVTTPAPASAVDVVLPGEMKPQEPRNRRLGGLASKIRTVGDIMDELQRDLMQERWDLVEGYLAQLRSYVPVFTTYTDTAFPSDAPTDKGLRVALRYEVGRLFACLERFKLATSRKALEEAYTAYAEMSLHLDRYLRVGGLYSYYDDTISNEPFFKGVSDSALVFADPQKDPPLARDLIVLVSGPDKGKTGIVLAQYHDGSHRTVVKMDRFKGMREIKVVPNKWVAKRLGEQAPDDVFLIPRKSSSGNHG